MEDYATRLEQVCYNTVMACCTASVEALIRSYKSNALIYTDLEVGTLFCNLDPDLSTMAHTCWIVWLWGGRLAVGWWEVIWLGDGGR